MKILLLIISLACFLTPVFADDEVYLDLNANDIHQYKKYTPDFQNENKKYTDNTDEKDMIFHPFQYIKEEAKELYSDKTITNKKEKRFGKTNVGAKFDTTLAPESVSQKRTLYTNYDLTEKMSVGADYQTSTSGGTDSVVKGTAGFGPEYKLTDKVKLKNKYSKNFANDTNKGEVSVEYKPFKDDRMDFNAGAAQTQQDGGPGSSQVNFGTNFRF